MSRSIKLIFLLIVCGFIFVILADHENVVMAFIIPLSLFYYIYKSYINVADAQYYAIAASEVEDGNVDAGLWTKAMVISNGNEDICRLKYLEMRAKQLQKWW